MKYNKKKLTCFMAVLLLVAVIVGCLTPKHVAKGWSGEYSRKKYEQTIGTYRITRKPFSIKGGNVKEQVSFRVSFMPKQCRVMYVSKVDEQRGKYYEIDHYSDMSIAVTLSGNEVTVEIPNHDEMREHKTWSYLLCITDTNGKGHYYYFRISYI